MPTEMLTKHEHRVSPASPPAAVSTDEDERRVAVLTQIKRVRRLRINVAAWLLGSILLTALWVLNEWQANGAFERFGHAGNRGDWNPTLWALAVGGWGLIVGIMALRAHVERPATEAELDREVERSTPHGTARNAPTTAELRRFAGVRLERVRRFRFHVAAWVLGMIVLTPLWALIEWQDNGGFQRFSNNSQPGDWEPWILYIGGVWALVIAVLALQAHVVRPAKEAGIEDKVRRLRPHS